MIFSVLNDYLTTTTISSSSVVMRIKEFFCAVVVVNTLFSKLQVITFVHTMLRNKKLTKLRTCLVLCPLNTILNWESEFENWLADVSSIDVGNRVV